MRSEDQDLHPVAEDYLQRLEEAARQLPPDRRRELLSEVQAHLAEAIPPGATDSEALEVVERLGTPEEIVEADESYDPAVPRSADRRGAREWSAVFLLPLGGFLFGIGWILGLIMLWSSRLWTTRDKLIGTLIIPGGLATALVVLIVTSLTKVTQVCGPQAATVVTGPSGPPGRPHFSSPGPTQCVTTGQSGAPNTLLHIVLLVVLALAPIASAVYLARRARNGPMPA